METMRDIKRRINSIKNTQKITKAMKMVAAAKLKKAQLKAENARPFFEKTRSILIDVARRTRQKDIHPLLREKENNRSLFVMITADRGLCGAYNARVIDRVKKLTEKEDEVNFLAVGRKGRDFFGKRGYNIISEYINIDDYPDYSLAGKIGEEIISLFLDDVVDRVVLVYTYFNSAISQEVRDLTLLPLTPPDDKNQEEGKINTEYLYEPSPEAVMDILLPSYIKNILYSALIEAKASEFGARMTAMDAATDNAGELIDKLTLSYNRARQAAITKEITEIVGGAEALK
ncbi:ATP synthase F1 subunit gamma [Halothermothrix orenii]|uniref:ATP synthase gamma chain n=1 Tax=Halothermothrix orenii (strain H 168 / OCM 544 / DSM 9562) TaxID=373903 RepID=ATPG_HALOH|nr:ATP synthase F1 subunit gamma [Halothermothrix orenii]B8CZ11.1 RecName: Full=ATP synthase gamma chain; AltName: Full=ATP synthase F1 sector gamma subunit; AltName: Full=F-ATPase gamma subunit [Halothermothrix orenii H 168]ACL70530.1 ATP synthase F1, gamma subunit [Halothermothrix orenii H 168]